MTEKTDGGCCARVWSGWQHHTCGNKTKMTHEGKPYCGIHDPVKRAAKDKERREKWDREWEEKKKRMKDAENERIFKQRCADAIRKIADGHNDPRSLAQSVLDGTDII